MDDIHTAIVTTNNGFCMVLSSSRTEPVSYTPSGRDDKSGQFSFQKKKKKWRRFKNQQPQLYGALLFRGLVRHNTA